MKEDNFQKIVIGLMIIQTLIILWGVWYIATVSDRKISEDCSNFVGSWIDSNPKLSSDTILKLSNDCYEQGGSKEWQLTQYIKEIHEDVSNFTSR